MYRHVYGIVHGFVGKTVIPCGNETLKGMQKTTGSISFYVAVACSLPRDFPLEKARQIYLNPDFL